MSGRKCNRAGSFSKYFFTRQTSPRKATIASKKITINCTPSDQIQQRYGQVEPCHKVKRECSLNVPFFI